MANETKIELKRRLVLGKWRGVADRGEVGRHMERLLSNVDQLNDLVGKLATQDEEIEKLKADLEEAREEIKSLQDDRDEHAERAEQVLHDVKYWMLEPLVHHQPMRDPRKILRRIEDVLG